ncbi:MAG: NFACT family protein [Oscillospiraceae bacterium]|nr:NFACT family protein [Oscillospiraceae bacterium]
MPYDGVVTACVAFELNKLLSGGRVDKVFQPERDEVNLMIRNSGANYRLLLSANPSHPRAYITQNSKENPSSAPLFCMILRKHLSGGRIIEVSSGGFERVITFRIASPDEMGDITEKELIIEIMGKHSNIILVNAAGKIIDAIKHIDCDVSRVREVMPAREYMAPPTQGKLVPGACTAGDITDAVKSLRAAAPMLHLERALLDTIMGFSPLLCRELCYRANLDQDAQIDHLNDNDFTVLENRIRDVFDILKDHQYSPCLIYDSSDPDRGRLLDFHCLKIGVIGFAAPEDSVNNALDHFYYERGIAESLRQRKAHLLKLVNNNIDRCNKKIAIQQESMRDASKMDMYRLYGELLQANAHSVVSGSKSARLHNYYGEDNGFVEVPLNEDLSPQANAQVYFKKYRKAKSTWENTSIQYDESVKELDYLETVLHWLETSKGSEEINEVRQELIDQRYAGPQGKKRGGGQTGGRRQGGGQRSGLQTGGMQAGDEQLRGNQKNGGQKNGGKKRGGMKSGGLKGGNRKTGLLSSPDLYFSSDGIRMYVGRNNRQNDALTLKTASSEDIWLHVKNTPGSHVIIKKGPGEIPERTVFEGAMLAALFSKARMSANVNVDYTSVRNVKKPSGAMPGMVIYDNYKTIVVTPDNSFLSSLTKSDV